MTKKDDKFKVPARESAMRHPPSAVSGATKVGSLVRYYLHPLEDAATGPASTGWIIQTPLMPGGQTNSYLLVDYNALTGVVAGSNYQLPVRIDADQIISVLEPELP